MLDLFKNGILAGLGAAVVTRDKVEEKLKKLVDEGKLTREEAKRTADELLESGRGQWEEVKKRIAEAVANGIEPLGLVRRDDFQVLEKRVKDMEERLKAHDIRVKSLEERAAETGTAKEQGAGNG